MTKVKCGVSAAFLRFDWMSAGCERLTSILCTHLLVAAEILHVIVSHIAIMATNPPLPSRSRPLLNFDDPLQPAQQAPPSSTTKPQERHTGLRIPSNRKTIYDRNINRTRTAELSRASFAYLFAEMVTYAQKRVTGIQDLERRLNEQGYPLGLRLTPLRMFTMVPFSALY